MGARYHVHCTCAVLTRHAGISCLIAGSSLPIVYYGFYCTPVWLTIHFVLCASVNGACILVNLTPRFKHSNYRVFRVFMFVASGVYGVLPLLHLLATVHEGEVRRGPPETRAPCSRPHLSLTLGCWGALA